MCPACIATAAWIAASATSAGGLIALVVQKFRAGGNAKGAEAAGEAEGRDEVAIASPTASEPLRRIRAAQSGVSRTRRVTLPANPALQTHERLPTSDFFRFGR